MTDRSSDPIAEPKKKRSRRWLWRTLILTTAAAMFAMGAIPGLLSGDRAREWILGKANKILAPGKLEIVSLNFSWFAPTSITGLVLRDAKGEAIVRAGEIEWNRRLGQIILGYPNMGTFELNHAVINIEREADGTIDLHETLRPIIGRDPRVEMKVVVNNGTFGFWTAELAEPVRAEHFDCTLDIGANPKPMSWKVKLANWPENQSLQMLSCDGRYDQWHVRDGVPSDLQITVNSQLWPITLALSKTNGTAKARLEGTISAEWNHDRLKLDGDASVLGFNLENVDIYGFKLGPLDLALHSKDDVVSIEPIELKVNSGLVHLEPEFVTKEKGGPAIRLGPKSWIKDVDVNDEVSRRVLAFIAPVLGGASSVRGKVSTQLTSASIPLRKDSARDFKMEGIVRFQDVTFTAGSFAGALLDLAGQDRRIALKLDEPVSLNIADGRVHQKGLTLDLGKGSRVELDGWVDFDKSLQLDARLRLPSDLIANRPVLNAIVEGTKIHVPIRGTLDHPELDRDAGKRGLIEFGTTLLQRSVTKGLPSLFMRMIAPASEGAKAKKPE